MTLLSKRQVSLVRAAVKALPMNATEERVEDFVSRHLGFSAHERGQYFAGPNGATTLSITVAELTRERETVLRDNCEIPNYMVYEDTHGVWQLSGLEYYLSTVQPTRFTDGFRARIPAHRAVRRELMSFHKGHDLEALGATLIEAICGYGEATRGSGDQGIDAIGRKTLLAFHRAFYTGASSPALIDESVPGGNVFILASSKANLGVTAGAPSSISPAHIRELVGGWLIQRDDVGKWREAGIRMLSPVQMLLITTYRLSDESINECQRLGVHVWTLPQLIYLVCEHAPAEVFDVARANIFVPAKFRTWWRSKATSRLTPANLRLAA